MNRRIIKHLAFAFIGAATIAEVLVISAFAAASTSSASLWTATPLHQAHFIAIATYNNVIDFAEQILAAVL